MPAIHALCAYHNYVQLQLLHYGQLCLTPTALLLHVTRYSIFSNSSIILPRLRASIGVTRSYSSRPFLCTLVSIYGTFKHYPIHLALYTCMDGFVYS